MARSIQKNGYTIVEVMIFLAISGMMFVMAANFINGKQSRAQFKQGIEDINSQLQRSIDEVSNGYYQSTENVSCSLSPTNQPQLAAASPAQKGTNKNCVFLGKLVEFKAQNPSSVADPTLYKTSTIVGLQYKAPAFTDNPANYSESSPIVGSIAELSETSDLKWGLEVVKVSTPSSSNIGAIAILNDFARGTKGNGSQSVAVIPVTSTLGSPVTSLDGAVMDSDLATPQPITICFRGTTGQYATVVIGEQLRRNHVTLHIGGTSPASFGGSVCT